MKIQFRSKKIGIEKLKKQSKKNSGLYVELETEEYLGIVKYVASDAGADLKVGQKVYFATNFQQVHIGGATICVMEDANVIAIVDEETNTQA